MIDNVSKYIQELSNISEWEIAITIENLNKDEVFTLLKNYDKLFENEYLSRMVIESIIQSHFDIFSKFTDIGFWEKLSNIKYIDTAILLICERIDEDNNIFNPEMLMKMAKHPNIRLKIFPYISGGLKTPMIEDLVNKLASKKVTNGEMDILKDLIQYVYSETGPINSSIYTMDAEKGEDLSLLTGFKTKQIPKGFVGYRSFVYAGGNAKSLSYLFEDIQLKKLFLRDYDLLSSLSREDRTALYSNVDFDEINEIELQNVQKLLINGYLTTFNENIVQSEKFINLIIKNTDIATFRRCMKTMEFTNPDISKHIIKFKQRYLDNLIFKNEKISKSNYPWVKYENEEQDSFISCVMYRYFKMCPNDVYIATQVILDSINSLHNSDDFLYAEGVDVLNCLRKIINLKKDEQDNFTMSLLNRIKDARIILKLKKSLDAYLENYEEFDLNILMEQCKIAFGQNMQKNLTTKNSQSVEYKNMGGVGVYDLSECDNFYLLIHSSRESALPTIEDNENLISMSLLDNNHLDTFSGPFIFGFKDIPPNSIIHAYNRDARTGFDVSAKMAIYQKITNNAPIYTDLESFMNATIDEYNEIKIKAEANSVNTDGKKFMKPSYLLFIGEDIKQIPQNIVDTANKLCIDIYVIDKTRVKQKRYNPLISENEITHGTFQSRE